VKFDRHAFDLSQYSSQGGQATINFSVRELPFWDLLFPAPNDPTLLRDPGQFRAEFHDRIVAPLYPVAFTVIAFAWLGAPRTTRQNRAMSMVATILAVSSLRLIGFASMVFGIFAPLLLSLQYVAIVIMAAISVRAIASGSAIEIPAPIVAWWNAIGERLARRVATA
jgi:lipopolysaccharide export system permease protein